MIKTTKLQGTPAILDAILMSPQKMNQRSYFQKHAQNFQNGVRISLSLVGSFFHKIHEFSNGKYSVVILFKLACLSANISCNVAEKI